MHNLECSLLGMLNICAIFRLPSTSSNKVSFFYFHFVIQGLITYAWDAGGGRSRDRVEVRWTWQTYIIGPTLDVSRFPQPQPPLSPHLLFYHEELLYTLAILLILVVDPFTLS